VSTMPERKGGDHTDSIAGLNLCAIGAPPRFVISSDSSHHSGTNVAEAEVNSLVRSSVSIMTTVTTITSTVDPALVAKEKLVEPSSFCASFSLAGGNDPTTGGFSDLTGSDFLVGAIRTVIDPDTNLQKIYVPQYSVTNGSRLNDGHLFTEFNVGAARQISLSVEVRMRAEYNVKLLLREIEAAEAICLRAQAFNFEDVEKSLRDETNALKERSAILEKERNALDVKVTKLEVSAASKERELTDLNALITSVKSQNDNLVDRVRELETSSSRVQEKVTMYENCMDQLEKFQNDRMKVVNDKFDKLYTDFVEMALHLEEKLYPHLFTTIFGRRWLLTHGMKLAILRNVNFSLLAKLKSNKDASVKIVMDILHLEGPLAEKLRLNELQPDVDQLMVPIHRSSDKVVLGTKCTFDIVSTTANTTTTLSITFAFTSSIAPISVDDYEVVGADDQAIADGNAASFPNVDDAELNILQ
ncbi:hypothetical protein Tco_0366969, partial [Tanacetum coccineum]